MISLFVVRSANCKSTTEAAAAANMCGQSTQLEWVDQSLQAIGCDNDLVNRCSMQESTLRADCRQRSTPVLLGVGANRERSAAHADVRSCRCCS